MITLERAAEIVSVLRVHGEATGDRSHARDLFEHFALTLKLSESNVIKFASLCGWSVLSNKA